MKNNLKLFLTVLAAVLSMGLAHAQSTVKVTGIVTSAEDGLPMIGVGVMAGPGTGVITSLDGEYEIEVARVRSLHSQASVTTKKRLSYLRLRFSITM